MKQKSILSAILFTLALTACGDSTNSELQLWSDPFTGEEVLFRVHSFDPWTIYALDEFPESLALIARSGETIFTYDDLRHFGAISIMNSKADGAGQIYAYDTNGDGSFDRVELFSPKIVLQFDLIEGAWIITSEHSIHESTAE